MLDSILFGMDTAMSSNTTARSTKRVTTNSENCESTTAPRLKRDASAGWEAEYVFQGVPARGRP